MWQGAVERGAVNATCEGGNTLKAHRRSEMRRGTTEQFCEVGEVGNI